MLPGQPGDQLGVGDSGQRFCRREQRRRLRDPRPHAGPRVLARPGRRSPARAVRARSGRDRARARSRAPTGAGRRCGPDRRTATSWNSQKRPWRAAASAAHASGTARGSLRRSRSGEMPRATARRCTGVRQRAARTGVVAVEDRPAARPGRRGRGPRRVSAGAGALRRSRHAPSATGRLARGSPLGAGPGRSQGRASRARRPSPSKIRLAPGDRRARRQIAPLHDALGIDDHERTLGEPASFSTPNARAVAPLGSKSLSWRIELPSFSLNAACDQRASVEIA